MGVVLLIGGIVGGVFLYKYCMNKKLSQVN